MAASVWAAVALDADVDTAWALVTNWPAQSDWVAATTVRIISGDGVGLGGEFEAFTGIGRLGFTDPMVITEWDPPRRVVVRHAGRVVRGLGIFEVFALPGGRSRLVWTEQLDLPLGSLGRLTWPVLRPLVALGFRHSLGRLAESIDRH